MKEKGFNFMELLISLKVIYGPVLHGSSDYYPINCIRLACQLSLPFLKCENACFEHCAKANSALLKEMECDHLKRVAKAVCSHFNTVLRLIYPVIGIFLPRKQVHFLKLD